ncbi:MAG: hypothetical protein IIB28_11235 [Chloroflexi bacterium]|nr:hypothetical protein [Chloroflexota bacterium]
MSTGPPWGMINARKEAADFRSLVSERVNEALAALEKPDGIETVRQILIDLNLAAHS